MSERRRYGHYDDSIMDDGWYAIHVNAMTAEKLHSKAEIAAELAFRDRRIAELEQQVRWIPCSERLPVNDTPVLVHGGCAYYRHDSGWFTLMGDAAHRPITWNVTHWKPLPPPPSEQ